MKKQKAFILELNGLSTIYFFLDDLYEALKIELENLHEDDIEDTKYKVYVKYMSDKEIESLHEFEGF